MEQRQRLGAPWWRASLRDTGHDAGHRTASEALAPPDSASPARANGVLMSPNNGGLHFVEAPVDLPTGIGLCLQSRQDTLPETRLAPAVEPTRDRADRAVAFGQITPGRTRAQNPQNAVQDGAVMVVGPPGRWPLGRKKRPKVLPLPGRQLVACHTA